MVFKGVLKVPLYFALTDYLTKRKYGNLLIGDAIWGNLMADTLKISPAMCAYPEDKVEPGNQ